MEHNLIFVFGFLNTIFFSISLVQKWNLINSGIDLLSSSPLPFNITVIDKTIDNINVKFNKYFTKENDAVVYKKYCKVTLNNYVIYDEEVDFDKIESIHLFDGDIIVCPKGKYNSLTKDFRFFRHNYDNSLKEDEDWELNCINYNQIFFMMFYLAKNRYHIFYKKAGLGWQYEIKYGTIYAFKLLRYRIGIDDIDFSLAYIVKESGAIKLILKSYKIN